MADQLDSALDLWKDDPEALGVKSVDFVEHRSVEDANVATSSTLRWIINDQSSMYKMSDAYFTCRFDVTDAAGVPTNDHAVLSGPSSSIFKRAVLTVNGTTLEAVNNVGYNTLSKVLLEATPDDDAKEAIAQYKQLSTTDQAETDELYTSHIAATARTLAVKQSGYNRSMATRLARADVANGSLCIIKATDLFQTLESFQVAMANNSYEIALDVENDFKKILRKNLRSTVAGTIAQGNAGAPKLFDVTSATAYQLRISAISLWVPRYEITDSARLSLLKQMKAKPVVHFKHAKMMSFVSNEYQGAETNPSWRVHSTTKNVRAVMVAFQYARRAKAIQDVLGAGGVAELVDGLPQQYNAEPADAFVFDNLGLTTVSVSINGQSFPRNSYKINHATGDVMRPYQDFLSLAGKSQVSEASALDVDDWSARYAVYGFVNDDSDDSLRAGLHSSDIVIDAAVASVGAVPYRILCTIITDERFSIDLTDPKAITYKV